MADESDFDELIHPALRSIADQCDDLGMNMLALVEWEPNQANLIQQLSEWTPGPAFRLPQLMAHANGDIDAFLTEVCRRFDTSKSAYLRQFALQAPAAQKKWTGTERKNVLGAIRKALRAEYEANPGVPPETRAHAAAVAVLTALEEVL